MPKDVKQNPCFPPIQRLIRVLRLKLVGNVAFLITSKVLDVRRRGATTEAYGVIRRKPAPAKAGGGAIACPPLAGRQSAGGGRAPPFGFTQGHELVEWQMMP
jgi:hypothetical protein